MLLTSSYPAVLKIIRDQVRMGRVLEIGPGRLRPGSTLLTAGEDVELVAVGYEPAEATEGMAEVRRSHARSRAEYFSGSLEQFPLPDRSVDVVVSFGSLHAWPQPLQVLDEIHRVLKLGGDVFIGDVSAEATWLQTVAAGIFKPRLKALYRRSAEGVHPGTLRECLEQTDLPGLKMATLGPDLWLVTNHCSNPIFKQCPNPKAQKI